MTTSAAACRKGEPWRATGAPGDIAEEFAERLAQRIEGLRTGDPADPQTVIGPLISASAASRVAGMVDEAVKAGAQVRAGGSERDGAAN